MVEMMIVVFVIGYLMIAIEHVLEVNKATFALLMGGVLWTMFAFTGMVDNVDTVLVEHLGDTCETLVFLIGAMIIVELINKYKGFNFITHVIHSHSKKRLLFLISAITFFMSAVLDNMTTTIVMIMLMRRLLAEANDRWLFAGVIVIAGMNDNVTSLDLIVNLFVPCLVSTIVPAYLASLMIKNNVMEAVVANGGTEEVESDINPQLSRLVLVAGVASLIFVPIFKTLTGMPPFVGMMISLGAMWLLTEIIVRKNNFDENFEGRVSQAIRSIDMPTILFFLGILMAVGAL